MLGKKHSGFTLIEVLVAIAIFATLSVAAYQVVNQVQRSNELSQIRSQRLQEIQRAFVYMDSDFRQIAWRPFRHDGDEPSSRLITWQPNLLESDTRGLLFTRLGWLNPQNQFPRGDVAKVGYRLVEGRLERLWWRYPDTVVSEPAIELPILTGVEGWNVRFYNGDSWLDEWESDGVLPKAVEITLTLEDYKDITRVYLTSGGAVSGENGNDG